MASRLEDYLLSVIGDPPRPGLAPSLLRGFLGGCAGLYDVGLETYLAGERVGLRRRACLPIPVLSVGNLSVGGTGKTPMTQWLCRRLGEGGTRVAILSRGHGGASQSVRVVSGAEGPALLSAGEAGDEPTLLARTLPGVPVLVGKDRRLSGREAMRRFGLDALVLDDGFQFWQLARDLDIVLLDARRPFDNGYPLPRGLLREPKRHLRRAGIVVATRAGVLSQAARLSLAENVRGLAPHAPLFYADHRPVGLVPVANLSGGVRPLAELDGRRVLAVSAIAQPDSFVRSLSSVGAQIVRHLAFGDHARFSGREARGAQRLASELGAQMVVMTEKDAVKWPLRGAAGDLPTMALRIEMAVEDEERFLREVRGRLKSAR